MVLTRELLEARGGSGRGRGAGRLCASSQGGHANVTIASSKMNDSYVVREAGMSDVAAIAELQAWYAANSCASWRSESPSAAELEHKFFSRGKAPWVVAEEGGTVAGFAYVSRFRDSAGWADTVENSVYVRPGWEGRGIGKALMRHLIRAARCEG